ncbi:hypothetical protein [Streptomyces sp. NPDC005423]|uniref:hypothetical protein n=1 Tax=Streptomyces sp. NPDC005423 TaxID=3155343 RepID=UPI0033B57C42
MGEHPLDTAEFLNDVEGHLLLAAARQEGRAVAARFAARLDWLTEGEREEVARQFATEYLALTRLSWQRTAERGRQLRDEYELTYRLLRQRLLVCCLLGCAVLAATGLVTVSLL